jgi:hypothetical protein
MMVILRPPRAPVRYAALLPLVQFFARAIELEGKSAEFSRTLGRLIIASMRGIIVDYLITNDIDIGEHSLAAFREFIELIMRHKSDLKSCSPPAADVFPTRSPLKQSMQSRRLRWDRTPGKPRRPQWPLGNPIVS